MPPSLRPTQVTRSNLAAFIGGAALLFANGLLKALLLAWRPLGLSVGAAPYVAYAAGFAVLGVAVGWRASQPRPEGERPGSTLPLYATCVVGCALVGVFGAWLVG